MLPSIITRRNQWLTWNLVNETKIPVTPRGTAFKVNDPSTFSTYDEVKHLDRIAYCFTEDDELFGIDIDDCLLEPEKKSHSPLTLGAQLVLQFFAGKCYCEISPLGAGLKLIALGKKPKQMQQCTYYLKGQKLEIYDHLRFWTITQNVFGSNLQIQPAQDSLDLLYQLLETEKHANKPTASTQPTRPVSFTASTELEKRCVDYLSKVALPTKGNINNTLLSAGGHLVSIVDDSLQSLSDDKITEILLAWCGHVDPEITYDYTIARVRNGRTKGTPRQIKPPKSISYTPIDTTAIDEWARTVDDTDDETIVESLVPQKGLIRDIYNYYCQTAFYCSPIMGMATAMSLVETLFGRRVQTDNGCRTNDYNVVLAATGSGKENCQKTITRIMQAANALHMILPSGVQSGNGLLTALSEQPCSLWIKDEFGVYLEAVFGKKKNPHKEDVGRLLLELYNLSDSYFSGNAHSSGSKCQIEQPHLSLLGLSTAGGLANNLDYNVIEGGSMSRMSWWIVTERPRMQNVKIVPVPDWLAFKVRSWVEYQPEEGLPPRPQPATIQLSPEANERLEAHKLAIVKKQESESSMVSALWTRTAHRTLKFALCSFCSRIAGPQEISLFNGAGISLEDVEWGIKLSNWLTRSAVDFACVTAVDHDQAKAELTILDFVNKTNDWVSTKLIQKNRKLQKNTIVSAMLKLEREGKIEVARKSYGQKEKISLRRAQKP